MKNKIALLVLVSFVVCQAAFAGTSGECPIKGKLMRGLEGIFTAPLEWCNEYHNARTEYNVVESTASGIFVGSFMGTKRVINGAYDVLTFPLNWPKEHGLLFADSYSTALQEHRAIMNKGDVK